MNLDEMNKARAQEAYEMLMYRAKTDYRDSTVCVIVTKTASLLLEDKLEKEGWTPILEETKEGTVKVSIVIEN